MSQDSSPSPVQIDSNIVRTLLAAAKNALQELHCPDGDDAECSARFHLQDAIAACEKALLPSPALTQPPTLYRVWITARDYSHVDVVARDEREATKLGLADSDAWISDDPYGEAEVTRVEALGPADSSTDTQVS